MQYDSLANEHTLKKVTEALAQNGFTSEIVTSGKNALHKIKSLIPEGASVMNGASRTLEEIGFIDYLKDEKHGWNNLHAAIVAEKDPQKQATLRKQSVISDYYLGSAHAITETGEIVIASNTGSQMPHIVFTSPNIILVVSTKKLVTDIPDAFKRIAEYIIPREDENMKEKYGFGTQHNKTVILHGENPMMGRKVHIIFAQEKLGF